VVFGARFRETVEDAAADLLDDAKTAVVNVFWALVLLVAAFIPVQLATSRLALPHVWRVEAVIVGALVTTVIAVAALVQPPSADVRQMMEDAVRLVEAPSPRGAHRATQGPQLPALPAHPNEADQVDEVPPPHLLS